MRGRCFFEVSAAEDMPGEARLRVGDVVRLTAAGVIVRSGKGVVEVVGPLTAGLLTPAGPLTPAGQPNTLILLARRDGEAETEIVFGNLWDARRVVRLKIFVRTDVEDPSPAP